MYFTGICTGWDDIKNIIVDILTSNGWSSTTDSNGDTVVYKDPIYVRIIAETYRIKFLGRTSIDSGDAPLDVCMSDFLNNTIGPVIFPANYHAFLFDDEFFFVLNYEDKYQFFAVGVSNMSLPGTGMWISATAGAYGTTPLNRITLGPSNSYIYQIGQTYVSGDFRYTSAAMFWSSKYDHGALANSFVHNNIDPSYPWALGTTNNSGDVMGIRYIVDRLFSQPNEFNKEALLLPIQAFKTSATYNGKFSLILTIQNARHIIIDYLDPEEIIQNGSDQWMVFPWFKKRAWGDGVESLHGLEDTLTFGWAIRKN